MSINIIYKHSAQVSRTGARRIKVTPPKLYFDYTPLARLRACLHGVGDPGLVGLVSFVFTL